MQYMNLQLKQLRGLNNILPPYDLSRTEFIGRVGVTSTFLYEAKNVDITDAFHIKRRKGYEKKYEGNVHSLWSNGEICLFREDEQLKKLNKDYSIDILAYGFTTLKVRMYYVDLVDKIYCSDGIKSGVIENGKWRNWASGIDLRIREYDERKRLLTDMVLDPLPPGMLEYYNSRLYSVQHNVIWYSHPFTYELCDMSSDYIMEEEPITFIASVSDGLWVGTDKYVCFYNGNNPPFKRILKTNFGAIKGTAIKVSREYLVRGDWERYHGVGKSNILVVWASPKGICIGGDGGEFANITDTIFVFPESSEGCIMFRQNDNLNQILVNLKEA